MKPKAFALLLLLMSSTLIAQTPTPKQETKSKADDFSAKSGRLIKKEYTPIDKFKGCEFEDVLITDLVTGEKISALKIQMEVSGTYTTSTKIASLDVDEIDGFIKTLNKLKELLTTTPTLYTEIEFTSRGGFKAGGYYDIDKGKWHIYMKLEKYDSDSYVFMQATDLDGLIAIVQKAQNAIQK